MNFPTKFYDKQFMEFRKVFVAEIKGIEDKPSIVDFLMHGNYPKRN